MCEHAWEKGATCGWNQRTARLVLLPLLLAVLGGSLYLLKELYERNGKRWRARPVLCMLCVSISQFADIIEDIFVLSELREHGHDWYSNSSLDALGDVFLMYSLYLFAEIWSDNVELLAAGSDETNPESISDIRWVRRIYKALAILTVPWALLFALGSTTHHYDEFMLLYIGWGVLTGFALLTPAAFMMRNVLKNLPASVKDQPLWGQLNFMARVNLYEQAVWNLLITVTIMSIILFFHGKEQSAFFIGTASIAISLAWVLIHLQVVLFFVAVRKARVSSPVFDEALLTSLMDDGGFVKLSERLELSRRQNGSTDINGDAVRTGDAQVAVDDNDNTEAFINQI